jgi:hypothetical protein
MQSLTMADVYVTRGAPNDAALAPIGKGLEFVAVTHPSSIFTGQDAKFVVLFDGKPVKGQEITLHAADDRYADTKAPPKTVTSDAKGRFAVKVDRSGVYQIQSRYRVAPTPTDGHRPELHLRPDLRIPPLGQPMKTTIPAGRPWPPSGVAGPRLRRLARPRHLHQGAGPQRRRRRLQGRVRRHPREAVRRHRRRQERRRCRMTNMSASSPPA